MDPVHKFCTECGTPLVPGSRFCGNCGHKVAGSLPNSMVASPGPAGCHVPAAANNPGCGERIIGIVPFLEQGLLSVIHYTLIITSQRLIFRTWDAGTDVEMSEADDEVMEESCNIAETIDEIAHFRAKNWTTGPWQRFLSMPFDGIITGAPGSIVIPLSEIAAVDIVCETKNSTQDHLYIVQGEKNHSFDLMYSQGPYLFRLVQPLLGDRVEMADKLHKRGKLDRFLTGQEYK